MFLSGYFAYDDNRNGLVYADDASGDYPKHRWKDGAVYNKDLETAVGLALTALWIFGNAHYWWGVGDRIVNTTRVIEEDERLDWMTYRRKVREVWDRNIRDE